MNRIVGGALVLALALPALADQAPAREKSKGKPATPAQQYQALVKEYENTYQGWVKAFREAKTNEERQKIQTAYQKADGYAPKFLELAQKHPKDPAAVDALVWALTRGQQSGPNSPKAKAFAIVRRDHIKSDKLGAVINALSSSPTADTEKFLREVMEKNPDKTIQAQACVTLAEALKNSAGNNKKSAGNNEDRAKEAEKLFKLATTKYADVELPFQGLKAPNIQGIDQDGKKFKLSDYRGKVVLLDFWGNW